MANDGRYMLQVAGGQEDHTCALIHNILHDNAFAKVSVRRNKALQTERRSSIFGESYLHTEDVTRPQLLLWRVHSIPFDFDGVEWINTIVSGGYRTVETFMRTLMAKELWLRVTSWLVRSRMLQISIAINAWHFPQFDIHYREKLKKFALEAIQTWEGDTSSPRPTGAMHLH